MVRVVVLVVVLVGRVVVVVLVVDVLVVVLVGRVPDDVLVPVGAASPHPGGGVGVVFPSEGVGAHVVT